MAIKQWEQVDGDHFRGMCANEFWPVAGSGVTNGCNVCISPVQPIISCAEATWGPKSPLPVVYFSPNQLFFNSDIEHWGDSLFSNENGFFRFPKWDLIAPSYGNEATIPEIVERMQQSNPACGEVSRTQFAFSQLPPGDIHWAISEFTVVVRVFPSTFNSPNLPVVEVLLRRTVSWARCSVNGITNPLDNLLCPKRPWGMLWGLYRSNVTRKPRPGFSPLPFSSTVFLVQTTSGNCGVGITGRYSNLTPECAKPIEPVPTTFPDSMTLTFK